MLRYIFALPRAALASSYTAHSRRLTIEEGATHNHPRRGVGFSRVNTAARTRTSRTRKKNRQNLIEYRDRVFSFPFSFCFSRVFDDFHHARSRDCDSLSFVSYRREQIHALLLQPQRFNADCGPSLAKGTVANNNAGRDRVVVPRRRRRLQPPPLLLLLLLVAGVIGVV